MQHSHSLYRSTASSHDQLQLVRVRVFACLCVCGMACLVNAALTSLGLDVAHKRHKPERAHQRGVHARPEERTCVRLRIPPGSPVAVRQPCGRRMLFGRRLVRRVEDPHLSAHSRTHARTRGHCHCLPGPPRTAVLRSLRGTGGWCANLTMSLCLPAPASAAPSVSHPESRHMTSHCPTANGPVGCSIARNLAMPP